jgi:hypothetical protein
LWQQKGKHLFLDDQMAEDRSVQEKMDSPQPMSLAPEVIVITLQDGGLNLQDTLGSAPPLASIPSKADPSRDTPPSDEWRTLSEPWKCKGSFLESTEDLLATCYEEHVQALVSDAIVVTSNEPPPPQPAPQGIWPTSDVIIFTPSSSFEEHHIHSDNLDADLEYTSNISNNFSPELLQQHSMFGTLNIHDLPAGADPGPHQPHEDALEVVTRMWAPLRPR